MVFCFRGRDLFLFMFFARRMQANAAYLSMGCVQNLNPGTIKGKGVLIMVTGMAHKVSLPR